MNAALRNLYPWLHHARHHMSNHNHGHHYELYRKYEERARHKRFLGIVDILQDILNEQVFLLSLPSFLTFFFFFFLSLFLSFFVCFFLVHRAYLLSTRFKFVRGESHRAFRFPVVILCFGHTSGQVRSECLTSTS